MSQETTFIVRYYLGIASLTTAQFNRKITYVTPKILFFVCTPVAP